MTCLQYSGLHTDRAKLEEYAGQVHVKWQRKVWGRNKKSSPRATWTTRSGSPGTTILDLCSWGSSPTRATLACDYSDLRKSYFLYVYFSHMQKWEIPWEENICTEIPKGREFPGNLLLLEIDYYHPPLTSVDHRKFAVANGQRKGEKSETTVGW